LAPRYGTKQPIIYISICSLIGGFLVLAAQGICFLSFNPLDQNTFCGVLSLQFSHDCSNTLFLTLLFIFLFFIFFYYLLLQFALTFKGVGSSIVYSAANPHDSQFKVSDTHI